MAKDEKRNLFDALGKSLDEKNNKIMECSLDHAGADVATTRAEYIVKRLSKNLNVKHVQKN